MKPPTLEFSVLMLVILTLAYAGCATLPKRTPTVAIAVRLTGNGVPAPDHLAHIRAGLQPSLVRAGFVLAEDASIADYVLTVAFIPAITGQGGQVSIASFEPTRRFREAIDAGDTPEAKEWRRRQREIEEWVERQSRAYEY
jgi:hypothetical protein